MVGHLIDVALSSHEANLQEREGAERQIVPELCEDVGQYLIC